MRPLAAQRVIGSGRTHYENMLSIYNRQAAERLRALQLQHPGTAEHTRLNSACVCSWEPERWNAICGTNPLEAPAVRSCSCLDSSLPQLSVLVLHCPTLDDCWPMGRDAPRGGCGRTLAPAWPGRRSLRWGLGAVWCDGTRLDVLGLLNLSRLADIHACSLQIARQRLAEIRAAGPIEE